MGVDIVVWRCRIGTFNLSARRLSGKRAKPGARAHAGRVGLEVVVLATVLLLIIVGQIQVQQYSQHLGQERLAVFVNAKQKNSTRCRSFSADGFAVSEIVDLEQITVKSVRNGFCTRGHFFNQSRPYAVAVLQCGIREALDSTRAVATTTSACHSSAYMAAFTAELSMSVSKIHSSQNTIQEYLVQFLLLILGGDVELNPGPGKLNTQMSKTQPCTSTVREREHTVVLDVFRAHFDRLVHSVQPDVIIVTVELYSEGLISEHIKNDITTTTGVSSDQKSTTLVNAIEQRIKVDPRPDQLIKELCKVMQQHPTLALVTESISKALELHMISEQDFQHSPLIPTAHHHSCPPSLATTDAAYHIPAHTATYSSDSLLSPVSMSVCPIQEYIDHLKFYYSSKKFPGFSKEALRVVPERFIHLNLVTIEKIDVEDCATSLQTLHTYGNVKKMKEKRKAIEMAYVGKSEGGSVPLSILVEGAPGIGKSTFAWELCRQWGQGEMLQNWNVVVLLQLRNKQVREAKTLSDLLYPAHHENELVVERHINSIHGKGVLIIFDGYDELSEKYMTEDSIFHHLLFKDYLSQCTVMVTSRPVANSRLYTEFKNTVNQHVEIIGFAEEDVESYIESACQSKPDILSNLRSYLFSNPFLYSAAYLPFQCAVVTALYIENWKKKGKTFAPGTLTELYTNLVEVLLQRHADGKYKNMDLTITKLLESQLPAHPFWKLAELAAEGFKEKKYVFENVECDTMGMMQIADDTIVSRQDTSVSYCFLHHTLQDYLAALHWFRLGSNETVCLMKEHLAALHWFRQLAPNETVHKETKSPDMLPPEKKATERPHDPEWPTLFFFSGLSELKSIPIEDLQVAFESHRVFQRHDVIRKKFVSDASFAIPLLGSAFCNSRICHPSFFTMLFEAQSLQLTTSVFADKIVNVFINSQFDAFVTAWCLSHSDPSSSWYINMKLFLSSDFLEKKSIEYFEKQLNLLGCHAQHHCHGKIAGIAVKDKGSLSTLLSLDPHTQDLELLWLYGSDRLKSDNEAEIFATRLNEVYPNLKYLAIIEPEWVMPILSRLYELRSLKAISFTGGSVSFSLPLQNCKSLETMWLQFSTTCVSFLDSLVVPNINTLVNLFLLFPLTDDSIKVLCTCLCQATRHGMTLSYNSELSGAKALADAIMQNESLKWVKLQDVKDNEGLEVMEEYFATVGKFNTESKMSQ